jgi:hypothetical protein
VAIVALTPGAASHDPAAAARTAGITEQAAATTGGTRLWTASDPGQQGQGAAGLGIAVSPGVGGSTVFAAGSEYLTGPTPSGFVLAGRIVAYNAATGVRLWSVTDTRGGSSDIVFDSVAVSPGGSTVYATGFTDPGPQGAASYITAAYDAATGARLWQDIGPDGAASAPAASPNGSAVFVTGASGTVAYSAATGATLWTAAGSFSSVAVSADGATVFATGKLNTAAYRAATGATRWTASFDSKLARSSGAIAMTSDGSTIFVSGQAVDRSTGITRYPLVAYAAGTGAERWARTLSGATAVGLSDNATLGVSPDGAEVFIAEPRASATAPPFFTTAAYNATTGAALWVRNFKSTAGEADAFALAVSPDSATVYVTGDGAFMTGFDRYSYVTVAYGATTGSTLWAARYRDLGDNNAYAVDVSPTGSRVFVTGQSQVPPDSPSYHPPRMDTIAYSG